MGQDGEEEKERKARRIRASANICPTGFPIVLVAPALLAAAAAAAARTKFLWHSVQTEDANPPIASPGRSEIPLAAIVTYTPNELLLYHFFPDYCTIPTTHEMLEKNDFYESRVSSSDEKDEKGERVDCLSEQAIMKD
ncbi:hypothetical protein HZH68_012151 [Vespula germanica]|uniref:Uncharacterized protein n=1 Tax=Vespula germanica TaxID=30212 RepID=A0A834JLA5_VESGE|nr:hypothetical protein HZH68_012151 [Vespula germanica]